jgi:hypothetical protein
MGMNSEPDSFFFVGPLPELLESLGHILKVLFGCASRAPRSHVGLLVIGAELLAETDYAEVVLDDVVAAGWVLEMSVAPAPTAGDGAHTDAYFIQPPLKLRRFVGVERVQRAREVFDPVEADFVSLAETNEGVFLPAAARV